MTSRSAPAQGAPTADYTPDGSTVVEALLSIKHRTRPAQELPAALRRVLPDPMRSYEEWERFVHADLADMPALRRRVEAFRLRAAVAECGLDGVPSWCWDRLRRLEEPAIAEQRTDGLVRVAPWRG